MMKVTIALQLIKTSTRFKKQQKENKFKFVLLTKLTCQQKQKHDTLDKKSGRTKNEIKSNYNQMKNS